MDQAVRGTVDRRGLHHQAESGSKRMDRRREAQARNRHKRQQVLWKQHLREPSACVLRPEIPAFGPQRVQSSWS